MQIMGSDKRPSPRENAGLRMASPYPAPGH